MKMYGVWFTETNQWYQLPCGSGGDSLVFATPSRGVATAQAQQGLLQGPFEIRVFGDDGKPTEED